jgi:hypothetical protein
MEIIIRIGGRTQQVCLARAARDRNSRSGHAVLLLRNPLLMQLSIRMRRSRPVRRLQLLARASDGRDPAVHASPARDWPLLEAMPIPSRQDRFPLSPLRSRHDFSRNAARSHRFRMGLDPH